jgi:hypothetical protein
MATPTLDSLVSDINAYPATHMELEIEEVDFPNSQLNVNEIGTFKVRVTNRGPLDVGMLSLTITGLNGTTVAANLPGSQFVPTFGTLPLPVVGGHGGSVITTGLPFKFKAPSTPRSTQDLVKVTIGQWNGILDHLLDDHSGPDPNVQASTATTSSLCRARCSPARSKAGTSRDDQPASARWPYGFVPACHGSGTLKAAARQAGSGSYWCAGGSAT